jgi:hypothetical protein
MEGIAMFVSGKVGKVGFIVLVVEEDILPLVSPGNNMVKGVRKMNPGLSRPADFLPENPPQDNTLLPLPDPIFTFRPHGKHKP